MPPLEPPTMYLQGQWCSVVVDGLESSEVNSQTQNEPSEATAKRKNATPIVPLEIVPER